MVDEEIWEGVVGHELRYKVSNFGNVKSITKKGEKILSPIHHHSGYLFLNIGGKKLSIHRIVMYAFKGPSTLQVDHINADKKDNRLSNLQYLTNRQNRLKYYAEKRGEDLAGIYFRTNKWVVAIEIEGRTNFFGSYKTQQEAKKVHTEIIEKLNNYEINKCI